MLDYLFGAANDFGLSPTDMPANAFTLDLAARAAAQGANDTIWSASSYQSYPSQYPWPNSDVSWMVPPVQRPRGGNGNTLSFSQLLDLSDSACAGYNVEPLSEPFDADQMLMVRLVCSSQARLSHATHSSCFAACCVCDSDHPRFLWLVSVTSFVFRAVI